ncbi:hypothetical protein MBLNU230_g0752t1 [Neophaeotheca triangularis]
MSSMRNAVQRRNHRERAQPEERKKWGLLEKHSDYSARARDHNTKKRKIRALQAKAADRNEDEFYFGMVNSETKGGVKVAKRGEENSGGGGKALGTEVVKLMKTQDAGYLRTVLQKTRRERERVGKEVLGAEVGVDAERRAGGEGKVLFDEDGEAVPRQLPSPVVEDEDEDEVDLETLLRMDQEESARKDGMDVESESEEERDAGLSKEKKAAAKRKQRTLQVKRRLLEALQDRERDLETALKGVEEQRAKMNGTVGGVNKSGVKFKARQRKR